MKKILCVVLFILLTASIFGQQKFALVIGNGNYTNTTKLNNPVNDANDMANALQGLGFTVDKLLNGTQDQMVNAIMRLKNRLSVSKNSYGFLFYAGHGVQSNGENYLIPVDANIPSENFLRNRTVSVQEMLDEINEAGNDFNVVVLDACRDNPFSWRRSGTRGLTVVGQQPADSIIVYATSAGTTASDGTGRNGLFTSHLLNNLKIPGLEVTELFRRTNADVARASNNQQRPAVYNQFYGTAYLGTSQPVNTPPPAITTQPINTTSSTITTQPSTPTESHQPVDDFEWRADNQGGITITRYKRRTVVVVTIPREINGKPVTSIANFAFNGTGENIKLTSVAIPNSVTSIGQHAFANNDLTNVTIPNSVTSIEYGAFQGNRLTSVTIPSSVTTIGEQAFWANRLTSVTIPSSVTSIGKNAFKDNQLTSITIGANVTLGDTLLGTAAFNEAYTKAGRRAGTYTRPNTSNEIWTLK